MGACGKRVWVHCNCRVFLFHLQKRLLCFRDLHRNIDFVFDLLLYWFCHWFLICFTYCIFCKKKVSRHVPMNCQQEKSVQPQAVFQCSNYLVLNNDDLARPYYKRWSHHGKTPSLWSSWVFASAQARHSFGCGLPWPKTCLGFQRVEWSWGMEVVTRMLISDTRRLQSTGRTANIELGVSESESNLKYRFGGVVPLDVAQKKYIKLATSMQEFFGIMWLDSGRNGAAVLHSKVGRLDRIFNDLTSFLVGLLSWSLEC